MRHNTPAGKSAGRWEAKTAEASPSMGTGKVCSVVEGSNKAFMMSLSWFLKRAVSAAIISENTGNVFEPFIDPGEEMPCAAEVMPPRLLLGRAEC